MEKMKFPLAGAGEGAEAWTAQRHYREAEKARHRKSYNQIPVGDSKRAREQAARVLAALDRESELHYLAAIAAAMTGFTDDAPADTSQEAEVMRRPIPRRAT